MAEPTDDWGDATRRLFLANERTFLAWWRTGVTAVAFALGAAKLVPEVADVDDWPYVVIGSAYALLGVVCFAYAERRRRAVERAARRREWAPPDTRVMTGLSAAAAALAVALVVVLLVTA